MDADQTMLIVEDDAVFANALQRSMERRGFVIRHADGLGEVRDILGYFRPQFAIVDLKLVDGSGLECVKAIQMHTPATRIVVLTGFASIATAVEAIKLGACHYLPKPSSTNEILAAFTKVSGDVTTSVTRRPTSIKTVEWERIHETLIEADFNISEAARRLGMYRRTLARKLQKWRVK